MSKSDFIKDYPYLSEIKDGDRIISAMTSEYSKELDETIKKFDCMPDDEFWKLANANEIPTIYAVYTGLITADDYLSNIA